MQPGEYRLRRPYQGQVARPCQSFGGRSLVDDLDDVGITGAPGPSAPGALEPVLDHVLTAIQPAP